MKEISKKHSPNSSQAHARGSDVQSQRAGNSEDQFNRETLAAVWAAEWELRDGEAALPWRSAGSGFPPQGPEFPETYSKMNVPLERNTEEMEDARILAEEEAAWRNRVDREDSAVSGAGVGTKVTLNFGVGPDGKPSLLEVVNLGGGICCTGVDVLDVLRVAGIDPEGGGWGIQEYARSEKQRTAARTDQRAKQSADRGNFPSYVAGLLKLLTTQPLGEKGWGASFDSGSALVSSVEKLVPIPHGWTPGKQWEHSRDKQTRRNLQVLEKVDPSSPHGVSDSGLRIIIANAGRNASRADVFPGAAAEAKNGSGTWVVLSTPEGVIEEREKKLQRPDVMLGYQLAIATHVLSGSWAPDRHELKIVNSLKDIFSFETDQASLTEWAALGNDTAVRDYLKMAGLDAERPLPHVQRAVMKADQVAESVQGAIAAGEDEETWRPVLDSLWTLGDARATAASITLGKLAKERDLPALKSPSGGGAKNSLWTQYELNVDPREITSAMANNPRQTARESVVHNLLSSKKPSPISQKKYLWEGMEAGSALLGALNNSGEVADSILKGRGTGVAERVAARLAVEALTGTVKLVVKGLTVTYRIGGYIGSRIEAGERNLETARKNIQHGLAHPLVIVEGVSGAVAESIREVVAPVAKEVASQFIPGSEKIVEIVVDVSHKAASAAVAALDTSALRAAAEASNLKKGLEVLDQLEEVGSQVSRFRSYHRGARGTSEPAALYRGGSFETWETGKKRLPLSRWEGIEDFSDETEKSEGAEEERVATPARDELDAVHKENWSQCVGDWMSLNKEKQNAATIVIESVRAMGGTVSMEATGGEGTLLLYDPAFSEQRGRVALAVGDMSTAEYVAILVPGMGSSLRTLPELARHARDLRDECLRTRPGARVAIVAWMGYKAPRNFWQGGWRVFTEKSAKAGAELLRDDVDKWRLQWRQSAARRSQNLPAEPRLTICGMSYGSVVTGHAAAGGAESDNLVLLGSPGTGAEHSRNFNTNNIFTAATSLDFVGHSGWFGRDTTDVDYGDATVMKSDYKWKWGKHFKNLEKAHTTYYDPGTESLANISRVVVGKPEEVTKGIPRATAEIPLADPPEKSLVKTRRKRGIADPVLTELFTGRKITISRVPPEYTSGKWRRDDRPPGELENLQGAEDLLDVIASGLGAPVPNPVNKEDRGLTADEAIAHLMTESGYPDFDDIGDFIKKKGSAIRDLFKNTTDLKSLTAGMAKALEVKPTTAAYLIAYYLAHAPTSHSQMLEKHGVTAEWLRHRENFDKSYSDLEKEGLLEGVKLNKFQELLKDVPGVPMAVHHASIGLGWFNRRLQMQQTELSLKLLGLTGSSDKERTARIMQKYAFVSTAVKMNYALNSASEEFKTISKIESGIEREDTKDRDDWQQGHLDRVKDDGTNPSRWLAYGALSAIYWAHNTLDKRFSGAAWRRDFSLSQEEGATVENLVRESFAHEEAGQYITQMKKAFHLENRDIANVVLPFDVARLYQEEDNGESLHTKCRLLFDRIRAGVRAKRQHGASAVKPGRLNIFAAGLKGEALADYYTELVWANVNQGSEKTADGHRSSETVDTSTESGPSEKVPPVSGVGEKAAPAGHRTVEVDITRLRKGQSHKEYISSELSLHVDRFTVKDKSGKIYADIWLKKDRKSFSIHMHDYAGKVGIRLSTLTRAGEGKSQYIHRHGYHRFPESGTDLTAADLENVVLQIAYNT
ncbi:alpha/beta hydrolase family protein [Streptomyces sp. FIT100]|uniref:alpha/beta hydrolase family protein n=1 Tax=Streptomyces sp. FIT100 TaxID=2837956 RepID=UPI0021C85F5C|nr:alpha/beta hydrolase family protein [Streptomyces sp. FIT100]UUN30211.1 alpha/beta hydrolase family protein [Streptomyces sp. FIT100]